MKKYVCDVRVRCVAVYPGPERECLLGVKDVAVYFRQGWWDNTAKEWRVNPEWIGEARKIRDALNAATEEPESYAPNGMGRDGE